MIIAPAPCTARLPGVRGERGKRWGGGGKKGKKEKLFIKKKKTKKKKKKRKKKKKKPKTKKKKKKKKKKTPPNKKNPSSLSSPPSLSFASSFFLFTLPTLHYFGRKVVCIAFGIDLKAVFMWATYSGGGDVGEDASSTGYGGLIGEKHERGEGKKEALQRSSFRSPKNMF